MRLNFFCDIDGTLLPFGKGIPESTLTAVERARKKGCRFFLATGRSPSEIAPSLGVIEFSGGVYSNGTLAVYDGKKVFDISMKKEDIDFLLSYGEKNGYLMMVQCDDGTYMKEECLSFFRSSMLCFLGHIIDVPSLVTYDGIRRDFVNVRKILALSPSHEMEKLRKDLKRDYDIVDNTVGLPQSDMAEICLSGYNKGTGIKAVIEAMGEDMKSTVSIGDGANDIEMLSSAALGIAMGNATDEVKRYADWVTSSVDEDGFAGALEYALKIKGC